MEQKSSAMDSRASDGNVGSSHDLYLSGTNPKKIRLRLRHSRPDEAVHIRVYYGISNRVDAYVDGKLVEPLASVTFESMRKDFLLQIWIPRIYTYTHGANYYNRLTGFAEVILRGPRPVDLVISEVIELKIGLAVTEEEFFEKTGTDGLVRNIALLMGIPASRITIVGVGSAQGIIDSRRRLQENQGIELQIAIDPEVIDAVTVPPVRLTTTRSTMTRQLSRVMKMKMLLQPMLGCLHLRMLRLRLCQRKFLKVTCLHLLNNRQS